MMRPTLHTHGPRIADRHGTTAITHILQNRSHPQNTVGHTQNNSDTTADLQRALFTLALALTLTATVQLVIVILSIPAAPAHSHCREVSHAPSTHQAARHRIPCLGSYTRSALTGIAVGGLACLIPSCTPTLPNSLHISSAVEPLLQGLSNLFFLGNILAATAYTIILFSSSNICHQVCKARARSYRRRRANNKIKYLRSACTIGFFAMDFDQTNKRVVLRLHQRPYTFHRGTALIAICRQRSHTHMHYAYLRQHAQLAATAVSCFSESAEYGATRGNTCKRTHHSVYGYHHTNRSSQPRQVQPAITNHAMISLFTIYMMCAGLALALQLLLLHAGDIEANPGPTQYAAAFYTNSNVTDIHTQLRQHDITAHQRLNSWSNRLKHIKSINSKCISDAYKELTQLPNPFKNLYIQPCITRTTEGLEIDSSHTLHINEYYTDSTATPPLSAQMQHGRLITLHSSKDGNCAFHSVCRALLRDESGHALLRLLTLLHWIIYTDAYAFPPYYHNKEYAYKEAIDLATYGNMVESHIFSAVSTIINRPIHLLYPTCAIFHAEHSRCFTPLTTPTPDTVANEALVITCSRTLPTDDEATPPLFRSNHYIPCIPYTTQCSRQCTYTVPVDYYLEQINQHRRHLERITRKLRNQLSDRAENIDLTHHTAHTSCTTYAYAHIPYADSVKTPRFHQKQHRSHCQIHAINNYLGRNVIDGESVIRYCSAIPDLANHYSSNGDFSITAINRYLLNQHAHDRIYLINIGISLHKLLRTLQAHAPLPINQDKYTAINNGYSAIIHIKGATIAQHAVCMHLAPASAQSTQCNWTVIDPLLSRPVPIRHFYPTYKNLDLEVYILIKVPLNWEPVWGTVPTDVLTPQPQPASPAAANLHEHPTTSSPLPTHTLLTRDAKQIIAPQEQRRKRKAPNATIDHFIHKGDTTQCR